LRISETRETTEGSAELEVRIQFPPAESHANHRFLSNGAVGDVAARERDGRGTEPFGQPQMIGDAVTFNIRQPLGSRCFDIDCGPRDLEPIC